MGPYPLIFEFERLRMRRTTAALSALLLSVGLASCSQSNNDAPQQEQNQSQQMMPQQQQGQPQQQGQQGQPQQTPTQQHQNQQQQSQPAPTPSPSMSRNHPRNGGLKPDLSKLTQPSGPYEKATLSHPARNVPIPRLSPNVKNDRAGVKETVRYFMASQEYVRQTGKARPLADVASASCETCWLYATSVNNLTYSKGNWYVGDGLTYDERTLQIQEHPDRPGVVVASFDFFENEVTLVENGRPQVVARPNTFRSTMTMEYTPSVERWIILHLDNQPR